MGIELRWWCTSPLGFMTHSELHTRLRQRGGPEEMQRDPNTWPWAALASIVLLHELLPGKGRGVARAQMLHNIDLV